MVFGVVQSKEDIYDYKGLRGVTMATNFGTKISINAHKCIFMRDTENVITYNNVKKTLKFNK